MHVSCFINMQAVQVGCAVACLEVVDCGPSRYILVGTTSTPGKAGAVRVYSMGSVQPNNSAAAAAAAAAANSNNNSSNNNNHNNSTLGDPSSATSVASSTANNSAVANNTSTAGNSTVATAGFEGVVCLSGSVTCMRLNHSGTVLFVAGEV